jgi:NAD+ kinase
LKKLAKAIKRVGFIGNSEKAAGSSFISKAAQIITRSGRLVCSDPVTAEMANLKGKIFPDAASLAKNVDLLLVFGGDGTMLRAANEIAGSTTPLLGINLGGLGFLTAVSSDEIETALKRILRGDYEIESRSLIQVYGKCRGEHIDESALNDFVISRGIISKLITLEVSVNEQPLTRYRCDGLIVSSPTGSTAYALSAGGAVVHPAADVFQITPICPHTLSNRSVIVSLGSKIQVRVVSPKPDIILTADGEMVSEMLPGDTVTIQRSADSVRLLHLPGYSFFDTLRRKLNWSGANV